MKSPTETELWPVGSPRPQMASSGTFLTVSADQLLEDHRQLSAIGEQPTDGITRLAYSTEEQEARAWLTGKLRAMGLKVSVDAMGNVEGRPDRVRAASPTDVLAGSHLDTVRHGGRYDGALGVVCAIHAVQSVQTLASAAAAGVVGFAAEESTRFGAGCIGSRGLVGELTAEDFDRLVDAEGISLRQALAAVGLGGPDIASTPREPGRWARAFLELHIDQAIDLQVAGCPIGIVTGIAAPLRIRATVQGVASHSGATRMADRKDALAAAASLIIAIEGVGRRLEPSEAWTTVGNVKVLPGAFNTVPGTAVLDVEIRAADDRMMAQALRALEDEFQRTGNDRGVRVSWDIVSRSTPAVVPPAIVDLLESVCEGLRVPSVRVTSRAAHDSMYAARLVPAGMILVRNRSGLSHSHLEHIDAEDIITGATVLANAMWRLTQHAQPI